MHPVSLSGCRQSNRTGHFSPTKRTKPTPQFNALKTQMEDERLLNTVQPLSREEIQAAQQQDPVIGRMYEYKEK